jgi:hypothetical protein
LALVDAAADRLGGDAEIDLLGAQPATHFLRRQLVELDLNRWMGSPERRERSGQSEEGFRRQSHSAEGFARFSHRTPARVQLAETALDVLAEELSRVVQLEPSGPVEQRSTEFALQPGDRAAQRRLGDMQLVGRAAEVLEPGHDEELPERVQIHHVSAGITA